MKKLMLATLVAVVAICANANTVNWGVNNLSGTLDAEKFANATAYLFYDTTGGLPDATGFDTKSSFSVTDLTKGSVLLSGDVTGGDFAGSDFVDSLSGRTYFYMAVISDDGKYLAISTTTKTASMGTGTGNTNLKWTPTQFTTYTAVPEPTSGLLMLVGLAGLALRRRRA